MSNEETDVAWNYHNGTKHPNGIFLTRPHFYDSALRPIPYKTYSAKLTQIPLKITENPNKVFTLQSISGNIPENKSKRLDVASLANILYFSGGITKTINFAGLGDFEFRAASCTGALYHIEIYVVCGDIDGLEAGVYHFDPKNMNLNQLRKGDFRNSLIHSTTDSAIKNAPAILVYADIPTRNSVKYRTREYRHAFWDSGTMIANTLAVCHSHGFNSKVVMGFVDQTVNDVVDVNTDKEFSLALVPIGYDDDGTAMSDGKSLDNDDVQKLNLPTEPLSNYNFDDAEIKKIHQHSSFSSLREIENWKLHNAANSIDSSHCVDLKIQPSNITDETIEQTIFKRGSTRKFSRDSISYEQLSNILHYSTRGIPIDYLEKPGKSMIHLYVIANSVDGLNSGSYYFDQNQNCLHLINEGDFRADAMHLGLNQALPLDGSVCIFYMANLDKILNKLGNRGYRAAQMEASIIGGRVYLAAYSQGLGATGLTFYDDDVTEFFSPYSEKQNTMFMTVLGKKWKKHSM